MSKFDAYVGTLLEAAKTKKLDFTKSDVNKDGKEDKTDDYLKKRNAAIAKSIASKSGKKTSSKK
jgi:hypothetical protein